MTLYSEKMEGALASSDRFVPLKQTYAFTGMRRSKTLDAIKAGKLKARRCGNRLGCLQSDIDAFLQHLPVVHASAFDALLDHAAS